MGSVEVWVFRSQCLQFSFMKEGFPEEVGLWWKEYCLYPGCFVLGPVLSSLAGWPWAHHSICLGLSDFVYNMRKSEQTNPETLSSSGICE